jgi:hypothetical protein
VYASPKKVSAAKLNPAVSVESIVTLMNLPNICAIIVKAIRAKKMAAR